MTSDPALLGFMRPEGRPGCRHHILVLPSVVCSTLVSEQIAKGSDGISFVHQNGCGHIGDDVNQTERAFIGVATNPNIAGTLVVSLGCETIQGSRIAERLEALGASVRLVGLQSSGGSEEAVRDGIGLVGDLINERPEPDRTLVPPKDLVLGVDARVGNPHAVSLIDRAVDAAATVVLATEPGEASGPWALADKIILGDRPDSGLNCVVDSGHGSQHHVGLAAAGAQVIISYPEPGRTPFGFVSCPVISVASGGRLHTAIQGDFDFGPDTPTEDVWDGIASVFSGSATVAERLGSAEFLVPRRRRST
ncbi:MAG: UxaA family hydrolase [Acidimicrobiia bacterium]|nr:MAG: UxaA family hydrolase [Acidimicrobiia bacterium]